MLKADHNTPDTHQLHIDVPRFKSDRDCFNYVNSVLSNHFTNQKATTAESLSKLGFSLREIAKIMGLTVGRSSISHLITRKRKENSNV